MSLIDAFSTDSTIQTLMHPQYQSMSTRWTKWRYIMEGGDEFISKYLEKVSKRETQADYNTRRNLTYNPAFAEAAIHDIKNAIFHRLDEIVRLGGSSSYKKAIEGKDTGVDLQGSSMTTFMGCRVLPEMLAMQKVGIYVDSPKLQGLTITENEDIRPYLYIYKAEDIRSWIVDERNNYTNILLRERQYQYDTKTGFPTSVVNVFRRLWKEEGEIKAILYNENGEPIIPEVILDIPEIPFTTAELSNSLLENIADYQIALLNIASSDVMYTISSNFPFYTEQYDPVAESSNLLLQAAQDDPDTTANEAGTRAVARAAASKEIQVGVTKGRRYPKDMDRPDYIHPSSEPLKISIEKQSQLKQEIRLLLNLSISNMRPMRASSESKKTDDRGLESGLSGIGLELENTEKKIAKLWAMYEDSKEIATISYPKKYDLRTEKEIREEAEELSVLKDKIPSVTYQKRIGKRIAKVLLENKITAEEMEKIVQEIEKADSMVSDPEAISTDVEQGLVSRETASKLRLYPEGEVEKAKKEHAERLAEIAAMQTEGARGVPDVDPEGKDGKIEKERSRQTDTDAVPTDKTRGKGK